MISLTRDCMLWILDLGREIVIVHESRRNPKNSSLCTEVSSLFSRFSMKPRAVKMCIAEARCDWALCMDLAMMIMSSRYRTNLIPACLRTATTGFSNLVKAKGALLKPNGRTLNW